MFVNITKKELSDMTLATHDKVLSIINYLAATDDQHIDRIYEFVVATSEGKVARTRTEEGWLSYVFVEKKND